MNQTPQPPGWITELFGVIDSKDAAAFGNFLTPDGTFRFGNAPPVQGRNEITAAVHGFFSTIASLSHDLQDVWEFGDDVICRGEVTYGRHDGSSVTLPFADVFRMQDALISDYRIYMDIAPLYADPS